MVCRCFSLFPRRYFQVPAVRFRGCKTHPSLPFQLRFFFSPCRQMWSLRGISWRQASSSGGFGVVGADLCLKKHMLHRKYLQKFDRSKLIIVFERLQMIFIWKMFWSLVIQMSFPPRHIIRSISSIFLGEFKDCCHYQKPEWMMELLPLLPSKGWWIWKWNVVTKVQ